MKTNILQLWIVIACLIGSAVCVTRYQIDTERAYDRGYVEGMEYASKELDMLLDSFSTKIDIPVRRLETTIVVERYKPNDLDTVIVMP